MTHTHAGSGVLLMTYGSPSSLDDVPRYITAIRGGRAPSDELVSEFKRRYTVIGGSPLIPITQRQAAALEECLEGKAMVLAAMRFSRPSIEDGLREMAGAGVEDVVGIILSPQYSPMLMGGYARDVEAARALLGDGAPRVTMAGAWHDEPAFVEALAASIRTGTEQVQVVKGTRPAVLLTAHSLPRRVAEQEPGYLEQLHETAVSVAGAAGLRDDEWQFCWQSAGHEPGEWMKPDFADLLPQIANNGGSEVLVAPVQFLADHLETLYDVDVAACEQAESAGLGFRRVPALNDDPQFIAALASVVGHTRSAGVTSRL
jgi:protoporphyrin/coproporphyrin ferrochelatase